MKIKILLLVLLLVTGIILGVFYVRNNTAINNTSYTESLALISEVKQVNSELNVLLLQSRYGLQSDYDELARKNVYIENSVENVANSDVGQYLASNSALKDAYQKYSERVVIKVDLVESFKAHNAVLRNSIKYAPPLGDKLVSQLEKTKQRSADFLESVNKALYLWSLYGGDEQAMFIQQNSGKILELLPEFDDQVPLLEYNAHIIAVVDEQEQTQKYLENALAVNLDDMLDKMESEYSDSYLANVTKTSRQMNYAFLAYGLLTLFVAAYFAWQLRKSYMGLEDKVQERTRKVDQAYDELKLSQDQLVQSEKMASLGQMIAGIAHEVNTPLGYVNNNVSIVSDFFKIVDTLMKGLDDVYKEAVKTPYDKQSFSKNLVQVLKQHRRMKQDKLVEEARELLEDSSHGLGDISELVKNLKTFSRLDRQALERFDVCEGLDSTLKIANSILRQYQMDVVKNYTGDVLLSCNPSKVNQVFLNIITNAAQAMPESGGQLTIDVEKMSDNVRIRFADTGEGMDDDTRAKMFDPFFTTKPVGEGTGLGMAISYKIVKEHEGTIDVVSQKGQGTVVTVMFPLSMKSVS